VREIAYSDPRHHVFFKLRARVTAAAAFAASMRPPRQYYDPSDPSFAGYSSLNGLPLGAFPLDDLCC